MTRLPCGRQRWASGALPPGRLWAGAGAPWRPGRAAGPACLHGLAGLLTSVFRFLMNEFILIGRRSPESIVEASDLHPRDPSLLNPSPPGPAACQGAPALRSLRVRHTPMAATVPVATHMFQRSPLQSSRRLIQPCPRDCSYICVSFAALFGHRIVGTAFLDPIYVC